MKKYSQKDVPEDAWMDIHLLLTGASLTEEKYPPVFEGHTPHMIETKKNGIVISGQCWFRGGDGSSFTLNSEIILKRPDFSNIQSISHSKLSKSKINVNIFSDRQFQAIISMANHPSSDVRQPGEG